MPATRTRIGIVEALAAAVLFGVSTPLAKLFVGTVAPLLLAGMLYLGSGIGLLAWWWWRRLTGVATGEAVLRRGDVPWLAAAIFAGGVIGPALLMLGLEHLSAADTSLLLNLESVFTAALAWFVFRENVDPRVALGMIAIVAGGVLLTWPTQARGHLSLWALVVAGACLAWALDNNLTRRVSASDPVQIAGLKGLVAGLVNTGLALSMGQVLPGPMITLAVGLVGLLGYGVSLALFVLALRGLGAARTGAYFSTAPFMGAALSLLLLREAPGLVFWAAAGFMALGVWLHITERHEHWHTHEVLAHDHAHVHDEHHQHAHDFPWDGHEPHAHFHVHTPMSHSHSHYPDLHHRHGHR